MDITKEQTGDLNAVVKIKLNPEDYQPRVEKAIKDQAKKAKLPGFRPGMVPPAHIKKMYGRNILVDEINNLLNDSLNKYLDDEKIAVLGQPLPKVDESKQFNWDFKDAFEFDYELGLAPEIAADFSSADKVTAYDIQIDEETLASRMKNIRKSYGKMTNPDVSAADDVLYSDLQQLSPDGAVFEDGISNTTSVRIEQIQDEAIKQQLTGLKKGDTVDIDLQKAFGGQAARIAALLNIDEDTAADLQSNFRITVKNVNRLAEADLNQEFFDKLFGEGTVKSEEEFTAKIKEELSQMMSQDAERRLDKDLLEYAVEKVKFELPDEFLKRWLKVTNEKLSDDELQGGYADFAHNLKWTLIENQIIKDNNIEIKYEDVLALAKQRLDAQFRMYGQGVPDEEQMAQYAVQFLQERENANRIFEEVKAQKTFEYLKSVVTLDRKEIDYKDFSSLK